MGGRRNPGAPVYRDDGACKVSVIVPCFNVEGTLGKALSSILSQDMPWLEVICIDDGSSDGTAGILHRFAEHDDRISIISKENSGYGAACNDGLAAARGHWISIVEPDDWIEQGFYSQCLAFASRMSAEPDIVKTPYWRIKQRRIGYWKIASPFDGVVVSSTDCFRIGECPELLRHHPSIWSALYLRSFIEDNDIRFHEIPGAGWADNPFLADTMCRANRIAYLDRAFYCYREDSDADLERFHKSNPLIPFQRWMDMQDIVEELGIDDEGVLLAQTKRLLQYAGGVLEYNSSSDFEIRRAMVAAYRRLDPRLVALEPDTSPDEKLLYARLVGISDFPVDRIGYGLHLIDCGRAGLRRIGPYHMTGNVIHYLSKRKARAARQ